MMNDDKVNIDSCYYPVKVLANIRLGINLYGYLIKYMRINDGPRLATKLGGLPDRLWYE
jgi:hypothetical protein